MKSTIEFMKQFQAWRRGADIPQPSPAAIGEGLDALILAAEQYEKLRRLNPRQYAELWLLDVTSDGATGKTFDERVDAL